MLSSNELRSRDPHCVTPATRGRTPNGKRRPRESPMSDRDAAMGGDARDRGDEATVRGHRDAKERRESLGKGRVGKSSGVERTTKKRRKVNHGMYELLSPPLISLLLFFHFVFVALLYGRRGSGRALLWCHTMRPSRPASGPCFRLCPLLVASGPMGWPPCLVLRVPCPRKGSRHQCDSELGQARLRWDSSGR